MGAGGGGGVRETMRVESEILSLVELTSGGGAFPGVWGSAVNSPIRVWGGASLGTRPYMRRVHYCNEGRDDGHTCCCHRKKYEKVKFRWNQLLLYYM